LLHIWCRVVNYTCVRSLADFTFYPNGGEIICASRTLAQPHYLFVPSNQDTQLLLHPIRGLGECLNLDHSFHTLLKISIPENVSQLYSVIRHMYDYTLTLVDYRDARLKPQGLSVLADRRNYVQHSLTSLPADSESKGMVQAADPFYELTRLGASRSMSSKGATSSRLASPPDESLVEVLPDDKPLPEFYGFALPAVCLAFQPGLDRISSQA
jgi:hypothetical protein